MSSVLKIKRSSGYNSPAQLAQGELAYSWDEGGGYTLGKLWIGTGNETAGIAANIHVIGGKYFVDMLDHTAGALTANSALIVDGNSKLNQLKVDNLDLNDNTISATNANGSIVLTPLGTGSVSISNFKITDLADPILDTDAANKRYVDAARSGLDVKQSVRAATTTNIVLSGTQTVDGVELLVGDRVLVKNQTIGSENGIYVVASGDWSRSSDADNSPSGEVTSGMFTFVENGTTNDNTGFVLTTQNPILLGTSALNFTMFTAAGTITAGTGLVRVGDTINLTGQALSLHNQATTGLFTRTSDGTITARSIAVSGTGISVANGDASAGNPTLSLSNTLAAVGGLTATADSFAYFTGAAAAAISTITAFARSLLDDADAATARTTLGLGTIATQNSNNVIITGGSITNLTTLDGVTLDGGTY